MKKIKLFLILLAITILLPNMKITANAEYLPYEYVADYADILTDEEEQTLNDRLTQISDYNDCSVVVLTVYSLEGKTAQAYADDYYDYNDFNYNGILFLISTEERDWAMSTCGDSIDVFSDARLDYIFEQMRYDLKYDDFNSAFTTFADLCEEFYNNPEEYDDYNNYEESEEGSNLLLSLVFGLIIGTITTIVFYSQLKSVKFDKAANNYVKSNSLNILQKKDMFLYSTETKTRKESSSNSNHSHSSTHRSSSGRSHGGRSGKF